MAYKTVNEIKVGDFFYSSWGYEQTNVSFYIVIGVKKSTIKLAEVKTVKVSRGSNHGVATPTNEIIGKEFSRRLNTIVRIDGYSCAFIWDGTPQPYSSTY